MAMFAVLGVATAAALSAAPDSDGWPMFGRTLDNTASTPAGVSIRNVDLLKPKWTVTTRGDVSARATVANGVAYFPDWGQILNPSDPTRTDSTTLWAVRVGNGKTLWSRSLDSYGLTGSFTGYYHARSSPAIDGGTLYIGSQEGAWLLAISAASGDLIWKTQLESVDPFAIISTSASVYNGVVYTGVASTAEGATLFGAQMGAGPNQVAPRGSAVAVNAATGVIQWKTYTVPPGYYGGGVWGSNPVVDPARNTVFIGTGNNSLTATDPAYVACIAGGGSEAACNAPNNFEDSVVALDMVTGQVKWANKLVHWNQGAFGIKDGSDNWNVDCIWWTFGLPNGPQCPANAGPDYDFGSAPNLITYKTAKGTKTILGAGQKSGIYYALDPDTGALLWQTQVGPGSTLGGMEWGSASDGERIYVQIANLYGIPLSTTNFGGMWAALDPATGKILWQTFDPNNAIDLGPLSVANGVVYGSSMAGGPNAPTMFALNAATGQVAWSYAPGASVNAGATIVGSTVLWGSGYSHLGIPGHTANTTFYAFSPSGK